MEQIHTQVLLNGQLAAFLRVNKRHPIDHLIKLACVFVPLYAYKYLPYASLYY